MDKLERVANAIRQAEKAGNVDDVKKLAPVYRQLKNQQGSQAAPSSESQQEEQGVLGRAYEGATDALSFGLDQPLENMADTADAVGWDGTEGFLRDLTEAPEGYKSQSGEFINEGGEGYNWGSLPQAALEQAGQFAGSIAARGAGAAAGGVVAGPAGAIAGGFAGPAAFEGIQVVGPTAMERAKNNGREEPNAEDWKWAVGTAISSGALNAAAPGLTGFLRRMGVEGATEGAQSVIQQGGETAKTEKGLEISPKAAVGEGIIGGSSAGTVDAATAGVEKVADATSRVDDGIKDGIDRVRTDEGYDESDRRLANRILKATDGDRSKLADVTTTGSGEGAQSFAKTALDETRVELSEIAKRLNKLAKARAKNNEDIAPLNEFMDDLETQSSTALNTVKKNAGSMKSALPMENIQKVKELFPNDADADRFADVAKQASRALKMTQSMEDMGGFSKFTRKFDLLDGRNGGYMAGLGLMGIGSFSGPMGAAAGLASGTAINRAARGLDRLTNRRSTIKRYVDSVERNVGDAPDIQGDTASQTLAEMKRVQNSQKALDKLSKRLDKTGKRISKEQDIASDKAKLDRLTERFSPAEAATAEIFEDGRIPENDDPIYDGYRMWEARTGMSPQDTLDTLEQLEREGQAPEGSARRYRQGADFKSSKETYWTQELVRKRGNPEYEPDTSKFTKKGKLKGGDPVSLARQVRASDLKPASSRGKNKAQQGHRASNNLKARIESQKDGLRADKYRGLSELHAAIDSPAMTRADRYALIDETIPKLFRTRIERDQWKKEFDDLASAGNDYRILRDEEETKADEKLEEAVSEAKTKEKKKKKGKPKSPEEIAAEVSTRQATSEPSDTTPDTSEADPIEDVSPTPPKPKENKSKPSQAGRNSVPQMVDDVENQISHEVDLVADKQDALVSYVSGLGKGNADRIRALLLEAGNSQMTVNMLAESYASKYGATNEDAVAQVNKALDTLEGTGDVKRVSRRNANALLIDGKQVKDADGNKLQVLHLEYPEGSVFSEMMEVSQAVQKVNRKVNQDQPDVIYDPDNLSEGPHRLFPKIPNERITPEFKPMFDFGNQLRTVRFGINQESFRQVNEAIDQKRDNPKRGSKLKDFLNPEGKSNKDDVRTIGQMRWQLADVPNFRQEWSFDTRGRVYSKNGMVHSQAGDLMKGMIRAPEASKVGGQSGLNFMFHSFGNLLGKDKESPKDRRNFVFQGDNLKALIDWSKNPFDRNAFGRSKGKPNTVGKLVKDSEGVFQSLNAANELRRMSEWAAERHGDRDPKDLLSDPKVREDIANNYDTDFIVQLDASNNSYQIASLAMGYEPGMAATGLMPQEGDPDDNKGADIYMEPAKAASSRVPALQALRDNGVLSDSKLRKVFKSSISNYLYDASFNSRKESFRKELTKIADGARVTGIGGTGLIEVPAEVVSGMKSEEGVTTVRPKYSKGQETEERVNRRVVEEDGKFFIENRTGNAQPTRSIGFDNADDAIATSYENDLYTQMSREVVQEVETRYPEVRDYLNFFGKVTSILKDRDKSDEEDPSGRPKGTVRLVSPDGVPLEYQLKEEAEFDNVPTQIGDNVVNLGVRSDRTKTKGKGLAASATHMLDAWVLRETYNRLGGAKGLKTFNPIHDSFGFHPSDTERGQATALEVMQEIGSGDYDLFMRVLQDNGISLQQFKDAGGILPNRRRIEPKQASEIPTAIS